MNEENKLEEKEVKYALRIPKHLIIEIEKIAKKHYRSVNKEIVVAVEKWIETFHADWKNKH